MLRYVLMAIADGVRRVIGGICVLLGPTVKAFITILLAKCGRRRVETAINSHHSGASGSHRTWYPRP